MDQIYHYGSDHHSWKGGQIQMECQTCGKLFRVYPYRKDTSFYCSRFCAHQKDGLKISKSLKGHLTSESTKEKISLALKAIALRGMESPLWKNGLTPEYNTARNSFVYRNWRNLIYKKFKWHCSKCGIKCLPGNIVAHHLTNFATDFKNRYNINNGMVLCRPCHKKIHGIKNAIPSIS